FLAIACCSCVICARSAPADSARAAADGTRALVASAVIARPAPRRGARRAKREEPSPNNGLRRYRRARVGLETARDLSWRSQRNSDECRGTHDRRSATRPRGIRPTCWPTTLANGHHWPFWCAAWLRTRLVRDLQVSGSGGELGDAAASEVVAGLASFAEQ